MAKKEYVKPEITEAEEKEAKPSQAYTVEELIASKKYKAYRDVLAAFLEEGKTYTTEEAEAAIKEFLSHAEEKEIVKKG